MIRPLTERQNGQWIRECITAYHCTSHNPCIYSLENTLFAHPLFVYIVQYTHSVINLFYLLVRRSNAATDWWSSVHWCIHPIVVQHGAKLDEGYYTARSINNTVDIIYLCILWVPLPRSPLTDTAAQCLPGSTTWRRGWSLHYPFYYIYYTFISPADHLIFWLIIQELDLNQLHY